MPSHSVMPLPIGSRRLPQKAGRPTMSAGLKNIKQRLGEKYFNTDCDEFNEWNDRRVWNGESGPGHGLLPEPHQSFGPAPPPPENLDWNAPFAGNRPENLGVRHRDMSPNIGGYMNFNDQPARGREPEYNEVYMGSERFAPTKRSFQSRPFDLDATMSLLEDPPAPQNSFSSAGYHSFGCRRGDSNFIRSSSPLNNHVSRDINPYEYTGQRIQDCEQPLNNHVGRDINPHEYSGQRIQDYEEWRPYDQPTTVTNKRRLEPTPIGPVRPRGGPEIMDRVFHIGGFKLPYIRSLEENLPQPETKSYTIRFFKKKHNYSFTISKGKERSSVEHVYIESADVNDLDDGEGRFSLYRFREDIAKVWTKIYRGRFYRNWDGWWKDFHSINVDIDEQLKKFDGFNVKYNFMPPGGAFDYPLLIKRAHIALTKNRNHYLGNMRVIFGLLDPTLLGNMPMEAVAQLQDIIRSVPNHLWIYKLRCVVYLWYNYSQVMASKDTNDGKYQHAQKEWNSPVIHWVAKQALIELRNISQVEYPEYTKLYCQPKNVKA